MGTPWSRVIPAGDGAILLEFGHHIDEDINRFVHQTADFVRALDIEGVWGIVPAFTTLLIEFDPRIVAMGDIVLRLEEPHEDRDQEPPRLFEIPVRYGEEMGPDLMAVADYAGMSPEAVIQQHSAATYRIYCLGFSPGFPLCGVVPEKLRMPRRASPRPVVPAGSVAIAGAQTGVYPMESPGGWNIIGRTPAHLFDWTKVPTVPFAPGDAIRFVPVSEDQYRVLAIEAQEGRQVIREVPHATA